MDHSFSLLSLFCMNLTAKALFFWFSKYQKKRGKILHLCILLCFEYAVCTAQFVVMFTGAGSLKENKRDCNAFISQSTRGLRSLLKEHV